MSLRYADALLALRGRLVSEGRRFAAPGIFTRRTALDHLEWIAVSGNDAMLNIAVGVIRTDVNRLADQAFAAAGWEAPAPAPAALQPPLVRLSLPACAKLFGDGGSPHLLPTGAHLSPLALDAALEALAGPASTFFARMAGLAEILDFILRSGALTDAEPHLALAGLALAGRTAALDEAIAEYLAEVGDSPLSAAEAAFCKAVRALPPPRDA